MKALRYSEVQKLAQIRNWKLWVWELPNPNILRGRQNSSERRPGRSKWGLSSSWPEVKVTIGSPDNGESTWNKMYENWWGSEQGPCLETKNKVFFHVACHTAGLKSRKWFLSVARMTLGTNRMGHRVSGNRGINTQLKKKNRNLS